VSAAAESFVDAETGARIYRAGDLESLFACAFCGVPFVPSQSRQRTCGAPRCQERRRYENKLRDPRQIAQGRARNTRWAMANGRTTKPQPWLLGAPPYGSHLPGGGVELDVAPRPPWAAEHRRIRLVHGMVTAVIARGHSHGAADFSLLPWPAGIGWGLYVRDLDTARALAGREHEAVLADRPVRLRCGPLVRLRAPVVKRRGHHRVRVDAVTPVIVSTMARTVTHLAPTSANLRSTLLANLARRVGVTVAEEALCLEIVEADTHPERVDLGGKFGVMPGWVGSVVVDCNAVGRWLLECAARIGLGGRTALGMGRVRVSEA